MKTKKIFVIIASISLSLKLFIYPCAPPIRAQAISQEISPTPSTPTITPVPEPDDSNKLENDVQLSPSPTISPIDETQINIPNETEIASDSASTIASSSAIINNDLNVNSQTGNNTSQDSNLDLVTTGNATATATLINNVNFNSSGTNVNVNIVNQVDDNHDEMDFATQSSANQNSDPNSIYSESENYTSINNVLSVTSSTGNNHISEDDGLIMTGDAKSIANLFNLVNTNLVGDNWYFNITNLFGDQMGDIILPYEFDYLDIKEEFPINDSNYPATFSNPVNHDNVLIVNDIQTNSNTGNNSSSDDSETLTGKSVSTVNIYENLNTNITGDQWFFLKINNFGNWDGDLIGWWGNYSKTPQYTIAWANIGDFHQTDNNILTNSNFASIKNEIVLDADTGNNSASNIATGNAETKVNIVDFINTNIIGNNWFFSTINVFDDFLGNVVLPRPNLLLIQTGNKEKITNDEEIVFDIYYKNIGNFKAKNVRVVTSLPQNCEVTAVSDQGSVSNDKVIWNLGELDRNQSGDMQVSIKTHVPTNTLSILTESNISTSTYENNLNDNFTSTITKIIWTYASENQQSSTQQENTSTKVDNNTVSPTLSATNYVYLENETPDSAKAGKSNKAKILSVKKSTNTRPSVKQASFDFVIYYIIVVAAFMASIYLKNMKIESKIEKETDE